MSTDSQESVKTFERLEELTNQAQRLLSRTPVKGGLSYFDFVSTLLSKARVPTYDDPLGLHLDPALLTALNSSEVKALLSKGLAEWLAAQRTWFGALVKSGESLRAELDAN